MLASSLKTSTALYGQLYLKTEAAFLPNSAQVITASSSGASLAITLSQIKFAPAAVTRSSQLRIHSPSPQPYEPKSATFFPASSACKHYNYIGTSYLILQICGALCEYLISIFQFISYHVLIYQSFCLQSAVLRKCWDVSRQLTVMSYCPKALSRL